MLLLVISVFGLGFVFGVWDLILWCVVGGFGVGVVLVIVLIYIVEVLLVVVCGCFGLM